MSVNTSLIPKCMVKIADNTYQCQNTGKIIKTNKLPIYNCGFCGETNIIPPSLLDKAINLTSTTVKHIKNNLKHVLEEDFAERLQICNTNQCGQYQSGRCLACGCYLSIKAHWEIAECPKNLWPKIKKESSNGV